MSRQSQPCSLFHFTVKQLLDALDDFSEPVFKDGDGDLPADELDASYNRYIYFMHNHYCSTLILTFIRQL